jgi:hypothetical protein
MPTIKYMTITLEPYEYANPQYESHESQLRIKINVWGLPELTLVEVFSNDDFTSRFDYIMDYVKRKIKSIIEGGKHD